MTRTLLVIDDDRDIRLVAKTSLELVGGFHVIVADSGHRGLAFANEARPDAILLDLMMPDLDGRTTLDQLKRMPETVRIPVIMLTANVQAHRLELMGKGAAGVLVKPFDPMQLPNQVCEILGWLPSKNDEEQSDTAPE